MNRIEADYSNFASPAAQIGLEVFGLDEGPNFQEQVLLLENAQEIAFYRRAVNGVRKFVDYTGQMGVKISPKNLIILGQIGVASVAIACGGGADANASANGASETQHSAAAVNLTSEPTATPKVVATKVSEKTPTVSPTRLNDSADEGKSDLGKAPLDPTVNPVSEQPSQTPVSPTQGPTETPTIIQTPQPSRQEPAAVVTPTVVMATVQPTPARTSEVTLPPNSEIIDGVLVTGPADFRQRTREALDKLKGTEYHAYFTSLIGRIENNQGPTRYNPAVGDKVWINRVSAFSADPEVSPVNSPAFLSSVTTYACVLVHEARHRDQSLNNPTVFFDPPERELDAYLTQKKCLIAIKVPEAWLVNIQNRIDCIIARSCPNVWSP